jgi:hypothetical protein
MTGHLIHIGYPKTGSNYLRRWFAAHPQLAYADGGIAGFPNVYAMVRPAAGIRYRVTSYEGLATPLSALHLAGPQAEVCTMLAELFPGARVLMLTRGYRSMVVSSYSQYVRGGGEEDFGGFCEQILRSDNPWHYDRVAGLYESAFGASNVIVMPYELLRDDAGAFTRTLANRLGIDDCAAGPERVNVSLSAAELAWYPRLSRAARRLPGKLRRLYARGVFTNRLRLPIRALHGLRPATPVSADAIPDELLDMLRPGAERLRTYPLYEPYAADYLG